MALHGYKIDMTPYEVDMGGGQTQTVNPEKLLVNVVLGPSQQLTGGQLYTWGKKLDRILDSIEDGTATITVDQYDWLKSKLEKAKGFTAAHREFIDRIWNAEKVPLKEQKKQADTAGK